MIGDAGFTLPRLPRRRPPLPDYPAVTGRGLPHLSPFSQLAAAPTGQEPVQAYNLDPGGAAQRVGTALAQQRATSPGMPLDVSGPEQPMVMKNTPGGPVYYGTPEAQQLAIQGLRRVMAAYGVNSAQYRRAYAAARGVLGADYTGPIPGVRTNYPEV